LQDRYVGDVGDFAKYALLRGLCRGNGERAIRLGVIWLLFPNENHNADGKHTGYLGRPEFRGLDDDLISILQKIIEQDSRSITSVLSVRLLPSGTVSCHEPVPAGSDKRLQVRLYDRSAWLKRCLDSTRPCDLVFFDPDNGLEVMSVPKGHSKAGKYIYWDELVPFWHRGNSLLIYHHLNRTVSAARQVVLITRRFATELDGAVIVPLVFRRGSSRVFWLIHRADDLGRELERRALDMLSGGWSRHFRPFGWPEKNGALVRAMTCHHLTRTNAKPIDAAANAGLNLLNESRRFRC
jgi:hypothetical protein